MNKEEAIKYLQQLYPNGGHCWLDEQRIEAISMAINALQEEPVSEKKCLFTKDNYTDEDRIVLCEDCDERCEYSKKEEPAEIDFEQELYKAFGQVKDFTLGMRIAKWFYDMGKKSREPVSEELGEYINELSKQFPEVSFAKLSRIAVRVAKWKEEQMIADATEAVVAIDSGGYPYIDKTIELYDYDKDVPLAKEGDKYKVVLIKED